MPPLHRAVALEEVDDVAVRVAEDLDFDVTRPLDQPLDVQRAVAERRPASRRAADRRRAISSGARTTRMPLPPPPADALISAGNPTRSTARRTPSSDCRPASRRERPGRRPPASSSPGLDLRSHPRDTSRRRPDEHEAGRLARLGERRVLGQEPVAGMDGIRAARCGRLEDAAQSTGSCRRPGPARSPPPGRRATCGARASASEYTATLSMPSSRQARMIRTAISPRLAMRRRRIMHGSGRLDSRAG